MNASDTDSQLHAARFAALQTGFKAAGLVCDTMIDAIRRQDPEKARLLAASVELGMDLAVQFVISDKQAKVVLFVVDDYGNTKELASMGAVMRNPKDIRKN